MEPSIKVTFNKVNLTDKEN